jgi:hypothetical protein
MPFPALVVGVDVVWTVVWTVVPPIMPTHTLTFGRIPVQSFLTVGFNFTKSARVNFWKLMTYLHVTPGAIQWNFAQFVTI